MHMTVPFLVFGKESEMSVIASLIIIRSSMKSSLSFSSDLEAPDYAVAVCAESIKKKKKKKEDQNRIVILDDLFWTFSNSNIPQRPFCKWRWDCFPSCASLYIYLHCISSIILLPSHSVFVILYSLPLSCKSE